MKLLLRRRALRAALKSLALPILVAACVPAPDPPSSSIQDAATYEWLIADQRYSEPINAWVRNKRLERFLLKAYEAGGLDALKTRYGFACVPRAIVPPCANCLSCRATLSMSLGGTSTRIGAEHKMDDMLIQLDIGPGGGNFSALTYWPGPTKTPVAGR